MSNYKPRPEPWHAALKVTCTCEAALAERDMVDDRCYFHRLVEAVEELREIGWTVIEPDGET